MPRTIAVRIGVTAVAIVAVVVGAVILLISGSDTDGPDRASADASTPAVVRDDSHRLNSPPDAAVTFVEFLDFECEG